MTWIVDVEHWPIVVALPPHTIDEAAVTQYLRDLRAVYDRRELHVQLSLASDGPMPSRAVMKTLASWTKDNNDAIAAYNAGVAIVSRSAAMRFLLSGLYLVQPPQYPYRVVGNSEQAFAFLRDCLRKRGVALSEAALAGAEASVVRLEAMKATVRA